jgi:hypothetical protein
VISRHIRTPISLPIWTSILFLFGRDFSQFGRHYTADLNVISRPTTIPTLILCLFRCVITTYLDVNSLRASRSAVPAPDFTFRPHFCANSNVISRSIPTHISLPIWTLILWIFGHAITVDSDVNSLLFRIWRDLEDSDGQYRGDVHHCEDGQH